MSLDDKINKIRRECPRCNHYATLEGHDFCLSNLPGVKFACCGHGEEGYIYFENGVTIRGLFLVDGHLSTRIPLEMKDKVDGTNFQDYISPDIMCEYYIGGENDNVSKFLKKYDKIRGKSLKVSD